MNISDIADSSGGHPSTALVLFGGLIGGILWDKAKRSERAAVIYQCAFEATKEFYVIAEEIMSDPATPETVSDMIYDMTFFVTEDKVGKAVYEHISEAFGSARKPKESGVYKDFVALSKHRLDLYEKVGEALSIWIFCMAAVHGHSDLKVTRTMVGATDRPTLFSVAEKLLAWLRGGDYGGMNGNGHALGGRRC